MKRSSIIAIQVLCWIEVGLILLALFTSAPVGG